MNSMPKEDDLTLRNCAMSDAFMVLTSDRSASARNENIAEEVIKRMKIILWKHFDPRSRRPQATVVHFRAY
jgi:hypothetical protein